MLARYFNYKPNFCTMEKGLQKFEAINVLYLIIYIINTYIDLNILSSLIKMTIVTSYVHKYTKIDDYRQ
jgi:hypothetical protein